MTVFSKLTVKELKAYCKKNAIKKYSKLRKKELVELIQKNKPVEEDKKNVKEEKVEKKVTLLEYPTKPFEMMNRYELVMECKKLKIRKYSKMKKKELIKVVKKGYNNSMQTHYKNEDSLFFYPDIIGKIFSYIDNNTIEDYRKKLLKEAPTKFKKALTVYNKTIGMLYSQEKLYIRQNNYTSRRDLEDKLEMYSILKMEQQQLTLQKKNYIYLWLKYMKYNVTRKMTKTHLINLLNEAFKELS